MYDKFFYKLHIILMIVMVPFVYAQYKIFKTQTLSIKIKYLIQKKQKNTIISEQNRKIVSLTSQISSLKHENDLLKKYNEIYSFISKKYNVKYMTDTFYVNNSPMEKSITIYTNKEIKKNDLVVDDNNILIGRVIKNNKYTAEIQLISDVNSNIPVFSGKSNGIIYGTNDKKCKIAFLNLSDEQPSNGALVITSGFEGLTLNGIIVGTIKKINGNVCVENENINHINTLIIL